MERFWINEVSRLALGSFYKNVVLNTANIRQICNTIQIINKTLTLYFKVSFVYGTTMLSTLVKIIWLHTEYLCEVNRIGMLLLLSIYYIINIREI